VAIVALDGGDKLTVRIEGERVSIDDRVAEAESRDGVAYFRKTT